MESAADARKKRFATYRYHALRVLLFAGACACAVAGMLMLTLASDTQLRAETVTSQLGRAETQANVLLVCSYGDSDPSTALERDGVVDLMSASAVATDVEYMDALNHPAGTPAFQAWEDMIEAKLAGGTYHAVICADDEALAYVQEKHDSLFSGMPVVFLGVDDFERARSAADTGYATGVLRPANAEPVVRLALDLYPEASRLLAVIDDTPSGAGARAQFQQAADKVGVPVEFLDASQLSRAALAERLAAAPADAAVFFLGASRDASGAAYSLNDSARFVASASAQPVLGIASGGVGAGLLGAGFTDPEWAGQRAAELCIQVLNGTSPADIAPVEESSGTFVFDAQVMADRGVSASALPADAVLVNESAFTWDSVRAMLPPVGLLVLGIALIAAFALLGYRHSINDTRQIIAQRNDLRHRFYHDSLTDQPNMQWLNELAADDVRAADVRAIVAVDFADFCDINDSFGRAAGDAVIVEMSERLASVGAQFLVRSMGAEFLLGFDRPIEAGGKELQDVNEALRKPVAVGDNAIDVDAHVAVANRSESLTLHDAVSGVDLAVREAKKTGSGRGAVFFDEGMKCEMEDKINITALLKQSVRDESFVVLYQPQVDAKTGEVCGYEALVRLKGNAYYPGQFIPVAEMSGLVIDIDRVVTKKVVRQLATWRKRHKRLVPVSVNYSAVQLKDEGYVDFLMDLLREHDVPSQLFKLEITESLLMGDDAKAEELFARLTDEGIQLALDDFGTGYTSLSRVAGIPAHIVKIDKSLVDAHAIPGKEDFLDNLVRLVHGLGKQIVVEGVETPEQLQICKRLGCDVVQGYCYSQPLLPERAAQFKPQPE